MLIHIKRQEKALKKVKKTDKLTMDIIKNNKQLLSKLNGEKKY